jgi:hypothetical protein
MCNYRLHSGTELEELSSGDTIDMEKAKSGKKFAVRDDGHIFLVNGVPGYRAGNLPTRSARQF